MQHDEWAPDQLRAVRLELGLTQAEAAARVGVTPLTWFRWERRGIRPGSAGTRQRVRELVESACIANLRSSMAVSHNQSGYVTVDLIESPRVSFCMTPDGALALADSLTKHANILKEGIHG